MSGRTRNDVVIRRAPREESFAETIARWSDAAAGPSQYLGEPHVPEALPEAERLAMFRSLPPVEDTDVKNLNPTGGAFGV